LLDGGLQAAIRARGRPSRVQCLYSPDFNEGLVEISVTLGILGDDDVSAQWSYSVSFGGERAGFHRPIVAREIVKQGEEVLIERPDGDDNDDPERLIQTALEQIALNRRFRFIADFLRRYVICIWFLRLSETTPSAVTSLRG